jgi:histidinol-phosphate aminotransferase
MARIDPRSDIKAMSKYHSPQVDVNIRLNTNESPFDPPAAWLVDVRDAVNDIHWNRYPDRVATQLRASIGARHGVGPENVFVANGSNEVLQTLLLTYAGAGRTVATFEPTYQLHTHLSRISGATVVNGDRRDDFTLDIDEVTRVLSTYKPDVTFLCSPNNPTGRIEDRNVVDQVVSQAPGIVLIDEAYAEFADWSAMELVQEDRAVAVSRTFSKTWSLAALRLGYLVGPSWMINDMEAVVLPYHLDTFKQIAGERALHYVDDMNARVAGIVAEREKIMTTMASLAVETWPSGANFILFRPTKVDAETVWQRLLDADVLVRDCSSWDRLQGCLRVTVGAPEENSVFLQALSRAVLPQ